MIIIIIRVFIKTHSTKPHKEKTHTIISTLTARPWVDPDISLGHANASTKVSIDGIRKATNTHSRTKITEKGGDGE